MDKSSNERSCSNVGEMIAAVHNGYFLAFTPYVTIGSTILAFHQCCTVLVVLVLDGLLQYVATWVVGIVLILTTSHIHMSSAVFGTTSEQLKIKNKLPLRPNT